MPTLVTLTTAKEHLRIAASDTTHDSDITRKADQASAMILDYLSTKANLVATIATSSVANPTVITTTTAHPFSVGQSVVITGHIDSTPPLNGTYVIGTIVDETSFTVPKNVTQPGTGGTATVLWTETTVPLPVVSAVLFLVTHLFENRGEDMTPDENVWWAVDRILRRVKDLGLA